MEGRTRHLFQLRRQRRQSTKPTHAREAGQQFEYAFDDIGNRTSTKSGRDAVGASLRLANYSANNLNQYSSRDVPACLKVLGIAKANAGVTVNWQSAYQKVEYFQK